MRHCYCIITVNAKCYRAKQSRRPILASVTVTLVRATIWIEALKLEVYIKMATVCGLSAFRGTAMSEDAVCVIAGMMPIDLLTAK